MLGDTRSKAVDAVVDGYDAITISPHKFLGRHGSPGILLMYEALYELKYSYIDMMKPVGLGSREKYHKPKHEIAGLEAASVNLVAREKLSNVYLEIAARFFGLWRKRDGDEKNDEVNYESL
ncbi:hypothetical protein Tco_0995838 [Tanacetum coccineum]